MHRDEAIYQPWGRCYTANGYFSEIQGKRASSGSSCIGDWVVNLLVAGWAHNGYVSEQVRHGEGDAYPDGVQDPTGHLTNWKNVL